MRVILEVDGMELVLLSGVERRRLDILNAALEQIVVVPDSTQGAAGGPAAPIERRGAGGTAPRGRSERVGRPRKVKPAAGRLRTKEAAQRNCVICKGPYTPSK